MNPVKAAYKLLPLIDKLNDNIIEVHPEYGKDHLESMLYQIADQFVVNEKAHRWLGYVQGCFCIGGISLEKLKQINKES